MARLADCRKLLYFAMLIVWALAAYARYKPFLNPMAAVWHQACDYCDRASGALEAGQKLLKTFPPQLQESWQWRLTSLD